jgi:hypothetical protein
MKACDTTHILCYSYKHFIILIHHLIKANSTTLRMKTEMVFETSVSTKAEPHYPAENPKELLYENSLVRQENIKNA